MARECSNRREKNELWQNQNLQRWTYLHMFRQLPQARKFRCIWKPRDTHSYRETWKQDEKKFEIRRSVEFSSEAARCIPWRVDGQSNGETCRNKRRIRWCGSFRIWNLEHPANQKTREIPKLKEKNGHTIYTFLKIPCLAWKQSSRSSENLRTRARGPNGGPGRERGYLGHVPEYHSSSSSSSWSRRWGEFTIRQKSSLEVLGTVTQWN